MEPEPSELPEPKVEASGGGSDKPRRPTAVGQGGPDDDDQSDWEQLIGDLRRYDLDELGQESLVSWAVPGLTFVRVDGVRRAWDADKEEQTQPQPEHDQSQPPKRMYLMEDALSGLHSQKANLAFLVIGSKTAANFYIGASLPGNHYDYSTADSFDSAFDTVFTALKSMLHSVYSGMEFCRTPFTSETMKSMVSPLTNHIGILTGIPALRSTRGDTMDSEQIERLTQGMREKEFGVLALSVPIPRTYVNQGEFAVADQIQQARENTDPEAKRRKGYYLELADSYLKHIQLGTSIGMWQVGVYYFAPDRSSFVRLQSLIKAAYVDETARPTPLRIHEIDGLKEHLEQFGLVKNQRSGPLHPALLSYKLLTPLNSRLLSAYVHLPKRDMPGFRVSLSRE